MPAVGPCPQLHRHAHSMLDLTILHQSTMIWAEFRVSSTPCFPTCLHSCLLLLPPHACTRALISASTPWPCRWVRPPAAQQQEFKRQRKYRMFYAGFTPDVHCHDYTGRGPIFCNYRNRSDYQVLLKPHDPKVDFSVAMQVCAGFGIRASFGCLLCWLVVFCMVSKTCGFQHLTLIFGSAVYAFAARTLNCSPSMHSTHYSQNFNPGQPLGWARPQDLFLHTMHALPCRMPTSASLL